MAHIVVINSPKFHIVFVINLAWNCIVILIVLGISDMLSSSLQLNISCRVEVLSVWRKFVRNVPGIRTLNFDAMPTMINNHRARIRC